jgi:hypothetical protein
VCDLRPTIATLTLTLTLTLTSTPGPPSPSPSPRCDRIVMSTEGLDLVHSSRGEPAYGSQIWRPSFTDHNKVYLAFSCA